MHHIVSDGWSIKILNKELKIFYEYKYAMIITKTMSYEIVNMRFKSNDFEDFTIIIVLKMI